MKLLLINGSPRRNKATYSFAAELKRLAEESGHEASVIHVIDYMDGKVDLSALRSPLEKAEILGFCTPLYVDTLPCPAIAFLEMLAEDFNTVLNGKRMFTVAGCGFPDSRLFRPIYGACRCFCRAAGMTWLGGIGTGGAPMLDGKKPDELGKRGEAISRGLKLALEAALEGREIPQEAARSFAMEVPRSLYRPLAWYLNRAARKAAKKRGIDIMARPYSGV